MRPPAVWLWLALTSVPLDAPAAEPPAPIEVRQCLVLGGTGRPGRAAVAADPVGLALVRGTFAAPREGRSVTLADGRTLDWKPARAEADGVFRGRPFAVGYAFAAVESDADRVMILEASGHASVYVNGEPRAGDPYRYGYVKLPVALRKGENALVFQNGRGELRAKLVAPRAAAQLETADATLPDLVVGQATDAWGAAVVVNASEATLAGASLRVALAGGPEVVTPLPAMPALSTRKVGFRIGGLVPEATGRLGLTIALARAGREGPFDTATVSLDVVQPDETRKVTFVSAIDGSVQYFGLVPARPNSPASDPGAPGLILTLHGAAVEGIGQARVYAPKSWAHVVAPTNRRPFGFDWEDWGRLDAIEVLELARARLGTDPRRTYLTGHSMGGHGTWHLGVTFPDRWAAIAPSAGWVSMVSYAGARPAEGGSPVAELLRRATLPSDTLRLAPNLAPVGVYVLHGSADDNVPVGQARTMRKELGGFHPDFTYHEQPGAGHWWGNECCDWPPLIEFLRRHELPRPEDVRRVDFVTASPGVSARCHWATVEAQAAAFKPSAVHLAYDPAKRRFSGTTENVARLALDLRHVKPGGPIEVELDGQAIPGVAGATAWFRRQGTAWSAVDRPSPDRKGPHRYGPFKDAFRNRFQLVYGTRGTPEENATAFQRARSDAERFWYQGNGSVDVVPDAAFDPAAEPHRNVIVYGHAECNSAWSALLGTSPVQVRRGEVRVGDQGRAGDDLACLFVRPRPGSDSATVAAVAGTGQVGLRLTGRLPYFTSGVEYPDCTVLGTSALDKGASGVVAAGYFGEDWRVESGEFAWNESSQGGPR